MPLLHSLVRVALGGHLRVRNQNCMCIFMVVLAF